MSNPVIRAEIDRIQSESAIRPPEILARLTEHARADIRDVTNADGTLNMKKARALGKTGIIRAITHTTTTVRGVETVSVKVELHDVQRALQLLGKQHKLFTERVEIDDWRSQAIRDIKAGLVDYAALSEAFDDDLARELFQRAGVPIVIGGEDEPSDVPD